MAVEGPKNRPGTAPPPAAAGDKDAVAAPSDKVAPEPAGSSWAKKLVGGAAAIGSWVTTGKPNGRPPVAPPAAALPAPVPDPFKPRPPPKNLGEYLASEKLTPETVRATQWQMRTAATSLLKGVGVQQPSDSQVIDAVQQLDAALKTDGWRDFKPTVQATAIAKEDGVNERLGNVFGEKAIYSPDQLRPDALKLNTFEKTLLQGGYENGKRGMILAATLIHTEYRAEADFSRSYGDPAWRGLVKATAYLDAIPKGTLLQNLDVETIRKTNELIYAQESGVKAQVLSTVSAIGRGGRYDHAGEFREGNQYGRPADYTQAEISAMEEAGITVTRLGAGQNGKTSAMLKYPPASEIQPRLKQIIEGLKTDLARPDADPIQAASNFQRRIVALHPFGDSNGRTSRALMNRVLQEYDLPPAILARQNHDVDRTPAEWRDEVAKGIAATKQFLASDRRDSSNYLSDTFGISPFPASPDKPVLVDGNPFDRGRDGLLYDPTGRAWLASGKELVPLSQLDHYIFSRRLAQLGDKEGAKKLTELTQETRDLYDKIAADPKAGAGFTVRSERASREADMKYQLKPEPEVAKVLTGLADVTQVDPKILLHERGTTTGTPRAEVMSRYTQVDLELWHLQQGLERGGYTDLTKNVKEQRAKLFSLAKEQLQSAKDATRVSKDNPMGFSFRYEQLMHDASPLRFASLKEAVAKEGDSKVTVWRGDYTIARLIGMAPNNDVRQPDAKQVANQRAKLNQITHLHDDLEKLEGSAIGRQYISTTSNLGLLTSAFATQSKSQEVNIGMIPSWIRGQIFNWVERKPVLEPATGKPSLPGGDLHREIADAFYVPGKFIDIAMKDRDDQTLLVTAPRKAFRLVLDRDALLPGLRSLGGGFEREQEAHGLARVWPGEVREAYEAKFIAEELPVTKPAPAPSPAP